MANSMRNRSLSLFHAALMAILLSACENAARALPKPQPNVVVILADDMGWGDVSRFSCADYVTTNLDRIANNGVMLTRACAWPVCSPSRAALLTGMDPKRVGVPTVLMPSSTTAISSNSYTLAEHLKRAGYATALIGKWHLGYESPSLPQDRGFETFFGHLGGEINYTNYFYTSGNTYDLFDGSTNVAASYAGQYSTTVFTEKAKSFIEAHTNSPFFLYLSYNAPHYPLYAPTNYTAMYTNIPFGSRRIFAAMARAMDDGVGDVLNLLDARGLTSNTMVWFMSDNGAQTNQGGSNLPFRGQKYSINDGGIRVPAMVQWPGHIPAANTSDVIFQICDVFPTIASAVDAPIPDSLILDGIDLFPVLAGGSAAQERSIVFFNDGNIARRSAVSPDWKYINTNGVQELYRMPSDVAESTNLANAYPGIVTGFEVDLTNRWHSIGQGLYFPHTNVPPVIYRLMGVK